ncbi:hypothetical protein HDU80_000271 [Chytriomyces hyalinus]|nr:hypothetical protein HDU80_000271 [Chytriomyces hyalinus]
MGLLDNTNFLFGASAAVTLVAVVMAIAATANVSWYYLSISNNSNAFGFSNAEYQLGLWGLSACISGTNVCGYKSGNLCQQGEVPVSGCNVLTGLQATVVMADIAGLISLAAFAFVFYSGKKLSKLALLGSVAAFGKLVILALTSVGLRFVFKSSDVIKVVSVAALNGNVGAGAASLILIFASVFALLGLGATIFSINASGWS